MGLGFKAEECASEYYCVEDEEDAALDVSVGYVGDVGAHVRNDIISKIRQGLWNTLIRPWKMHIRDGTTKYPHEHVTRKPKH